jgi:hypothetical protein
MWTLHPDLAKGETYYYNQLPAVTDLAGNPGATLDGPCPFTTIPEPPPPPDIQITPDPLNFSERFSYCGQTVKLPVTILNDTDSPVDLTPSVTHEYYSVPSDVLHIDPGATTTLDITFSPPAIYPTAQIVNSTLNLKDAEGNVIGSGELTGVMKCLRWTDQPPVLTH